MSPLTHCKSEKSNLVDRLCVIWQINMTQMSIGKLGQERATELVVGYSELVYLAIWEGTMHLLDMTVTLRLLTWIQVI
jgi:hypothetical protein